MSLLFNQEKWEYTFSKLKSECYCPIIAPDNNIRHRKYRDKKCKMIRKLLSVYLYTVCPTKTGKMLIKKVIERGLSVYSVYALTSEKKRCVITGQTRNLVMFKLRTFRRRGSDGVIQLGETRYYCISREWLTCIQAIIICARLQRYISHYALLDARGQFSFKRQIELKNNINGSISYMITMFSLIVEDETDSEKLLSLLKHD